MVQGFNSLFGGSTPHVSLERFDDYTRQVASVVGPTAVEAEMAKKQVRDGVMRVFDGVPPQMSGTPQVG